MKEKFGVMWFIKESKKDQDPEGILEWLLFIIGLPVAFFFWKTKYESQFIEENKERLSALCDRLDKVKHDD